MMRLLRWLRRRWLLATVLGVAVLVAGVVAGSMLVIRPYGQFIAASPAALPKAPMTGMVLGSGITPDGRPKPVLRARLDTAAAAFQAGAVDRLVVSGDNRFDGYDEPTAMLNYLVEVHDIPINRIQLDFAGRSTYESCERAAKVFQLKRMVLISTQSHLPRSIYLCRHFGIETYGLASRLESNNSGRREPLAAAKALFNIHVRGENTVLGDPVPLH